MKQIIILGSTGSIGTQTLDIIRKNNDKFKVIGLSVNKNINKLIKHIKEFHPKYVAICDDKARDEFNKINNFGIEIISLDELSKIKADLVLNALVGLVGLVPSVNVLKNGVPLAMANKETVVTAGKILNKIAQKNNAKIIPVDSEHSAIWQCMQAGQKKDIKKILLTASGGSFVDYTREELSKITPEMASTHPVWNMGKKVTVDSSTLMNKGLEIIEAMNLFDVSVDDIEVVVHRESIIHSMVEFNDNTVIACMSKPDMRLPIQYALTYPNRFKSLIEPINFGALKTLHFEKPNAEKFKCLSLAIDAVRAGDGSIIALSSADELLVEMFLNGNIGFLDIPKYLEKAINFIHIPHVTQIDDIIQIDKEVKEYIKSIIKAGSE